MTSDLIYTSWPKRTGGIHWHKMADTLRASGLTAQLEKPGIEVHENVLTDEGNAPDDLREAIRLGARIGTLVAANHESGRLSLIVCGS
jgi:hypothetical protein